jgi:hypothetical protein
MDEEFDRRYQADQAVLPEEFEKGGGKGSAPEDTTAFEKVFKSTLNAKLNALTDDPVLHEEFEKGGSKGSAPEDTTAFDKVELKVDAKLKALTDDGAKGSDSEDSTAFEKLELKVDAKFQALTDDGAKGSALEDSTASETALALMSSRPGRLYRALEDSTASINLTMVDVKLKALTEDPVLRRSEEFEGEFEEFEKGGGKGSAPKSSGTGKATSTVGRAGEWVDVRKGKGKYSHNVLGAKGKIKSRAAHKGGTFDVSEDGANVWFGECGTEQNWTDMMGFRWERTHTFGEFRQIACGTVPKAHLRAGTVPPDLWPPATRPQPKSINPRPPATLGPAFPACNRTLPPSGKIRIQQRPRDP